MTVARSVADVLAEHVSFEVECIDRMYLNVYQPKLQHAAGVVWFFRGHRGMPFASSALMDPMTKGFVAAVHRFARDNEVPWVDFVRGQRKDDVAHEYLAEFEAAGRSEGVLFIGRAQEKNVVFRTQKRRNPVTGATYPWIVRSSGVVNQFYVYGVDGDFGPFFLKSCSYFPYNAKLCINGHEWAKLQAAKAGIGFEALDNGFAARLERQKSGRSGHGVTSRGDHAPGPDPARRQRGQAPGPHDARSRPLLVAASAAGGAGCSLISAAMPCAQGSPRPMCG